MRNPPPPKPPYNSNRNAAGGGGSPPLVPTRWSAQRALPSPKRTCTHVRAPIQRPQPMRALVQITLRMCPHVLPREGRRSSPQVTNRMTLAATEHTPREEVKIPQGVSRLRSNSCRESSKSPWPWPCLPMPSALLRARCTDVQLLGCAVHAKGHAKQQP